MPSLYDDLFGQCRIANHNSDLYVKVTPQSAAIVKRHAPVGVTVFRNNLDDAFWYDVPFAYDPYWRTIGPSRPKPTGNGFM